MLTLVSMETNDSLRSEKHAVGIGLLCGNVAHSNENRRHCQDSWTLPPPDTRQSVAVKTMWLADTLTSDRRSPSSTPSLSASATVLEK
jgi:hypothetical protein